MRPNPFAEASSPIMRLYHRSTSQSAHNKLPARTRTKSFKQFQISIIRTALHQHRVIHKDYGLAQQQNMQRERQYSKYYGQEVFRYPPEATTPVQPSADLCRDRAGREEKRASDRMSTMLNIRTESMNAIDSHRAMTFESNFNIQMGGQSHPVPTPTDQCIASGRASSRAPSQRLTERKCSFFDEISKAYAEPHQKRKVSRFMDHKKSRQDHIIEQYFDEPPAKPACKRPSHRDSTRQTPLFCLI